MKYLLIILLALSVTSFSYAADESIELTTYYPAPYGDYEDLYVSNSLGVGTNSPDASAMLDLSATNDIAAGTPRGFLPPVMEETEIGNISNPAKGLIVYNTDKDEWWGYNGAWKKIGSISSDETLEVDRIKTKHISFSSDYISSDDTNHGLTQSNIYTSNGTLYITVDSAADGNVNPDIAIGKDGENRIVVGNSNTNIYRFENSGNNPANYPVPSD